MAYCHVSAQIDAYCHQLGEDERRANALEHYAEEARDALEADAGKFMEAIADELEGDAYMLQDRLLRDLALGRALDPELVQQWQAAAEAALEPVIEARAEQLLNDAANDDY